MGLTMKERKAVTNELASRYQKATKGERGRLLDEFMQLTGYNRCYASHMLHNWGTRHIRLVDGERVEVVIGVTDRPKLKRNRSRQYDQQFIDILEQIWIIADGICGKRLTAFIDVSLAILERWNEITLPDSTVRSKLLSISPATVDRLLAPVRSRWWDKGRSHTKPGTLLKHHIPIRTFSDWNEKIPGFLEIDLVAHDGGSASGDFLQTLDATDIATAWTETRPVRTKAQVWVRQALYEIMRDLPFPVLGIDSDNGGEFINNHLFRFCEAAKITFTRSRPFRKNDSCFVEQKNYSIVRKTAGYYRYDNDRQLALLNELYGFLRLYTNFFQPVMKLISKERVGSIVHKHYDHPQTPFQRLLAQPSVSAEIKEKLGKQFEQLNPAELKRTIAKIQNDLFSSHSPLPQKPLHPSIISLSHPWRQTNPRWKKCTLTITKTTLVSHNKNQDTNPHMLPSPPT